VVRAEVGSSRTGWNHCAAYQARRTTALSRRANRVATVGAGRGHTIIDTRKTEQPYPPVTWG